MSDPDQSGGAWTLLTGHGHVLVEIARNPRARIRDISPVVGLTERSVQAIVADLEAAGYLTRARTGRRVVYTVNRDNVFRHSAQDGHRIGPFLDLLAAPRTEITTGTATTSDSNKRELSPTPSVSLDPGPGDRLTRAAGRDQG
jgi:Winged helix-turn-helix DNA-binding